MRYKITVEYDGTNYVGWQKQQDQPNKSIEEILEKAILQLTNEPARIMGSGRTDGGVHAIAQVADFVITKEFDPFRMVAGLNNYLLPSNITVLNCEIVADNFSSRFDAKMRHYRYVIINRRAPLALQKNRAWHLPIPLDVVAMQLAANYLIGSFDFSAFRDAECQSKSPMKTVKRIAVEKKGDEIIIEFSAKSFLHHMVRNIVGTLVWVGSERIKVDDVLMILESRDRRNSGPNAPACGLYFLGVDY